MKFTRLFIVFGISILSSCSSKTTKVDAFPELYNRKITSILILPPINETTSSVAKGYYSTTIFEPLTNKGYYVAPFSLTEKFFKEEGIYDTEILDVIAIQEIGSFFGVDAVFQTKIIDWDTTYTVIHASLTVNFEAQLIATSDGSILWEYRGKIFQNLTEGGYDPLVNLLVTAINAAASDYVPYATLANEQILAPLPYGKYHPKHYEDQNEQFSQLEDSSKQ